MTSYPNDHSSNYSDQTCLNSMDKHSDKSWLSSVYSDGSSSFVSNPEPSLGETVSIRLQLLKNAPVKNIFLDCICNGIHHFFPMKEISKEELSTKNISVKNISVKNIPTPKMESCTGLALYSADIKITEKKTRYHFILLTDDAMYHYTQKEITPYEQTDNYDFQIMTDYHQPAWVKNSVFYQIFPERFANGDPSLDVKDGEFSVNGWPSIHVKDWNQAAVAYDKGHCLDFYGGDLVGIEQKIPYLKELGVTALYLNPIFHAPSVHKYDCIDYEKVDPHFGGDAALADLSHALHENDMKLMLDISINHTGVAHKWFNRDCLYFDESVGAYHNPDAKERKYYHIKADNSYRGWNNVDTLPTLDYNSQELREKVYAGPDSVLKKWLKAPYNIDGWRFDVADEFAKCDSEQLDLTIWPQVCKSIREENKDAYILAESWNENIRYLQGDMWDSSMNYYGFCRLIRPFLGLADPNYWFDPILSQAHFRMSAEVLAEKLMDYMGQLPFAMWQNQFNLIDSHDVSRLHNYQINPGDYQGAIIAQFTMIGCPSIYYGDEVSIDGWTGACEGCRYPMPWKDDMTESDIFKLHQKLAKLKKETPALCDGGFKILYAKGRTLAFARVSLKESIVTVFGTEEADTEIIIPIQNIGGKFDCTSDKPDLLGHPMSAQVLEDGSLKIKLPAHQSYVFAV